MDKPLALTRSFKRHMHAQNRSERTISTYLMGYARPKRSCESGPIGPGALTRLSAPRSARLASRLGAGVETAGLGDNSMQDCSSA